MGFKAFGPDKSLKKRKLFSEADDPTQFESWFDVLGGVARRTTPDYHLARTGLPLMTMMITLIAALLAYPYIQRRRYETLRRMALQPI